MDRTRTDVPNEFKPLKFDCTKTSNKFLNAWGKIIIAESLLDENMFVACMERLHL